MRCTIRNDFSKGKRRRCYRDFHQGFELMKSAQSGKIILDWAA